MSDQRQPYHDNLHKPAEARMGARESGCGAGLRLSPRLALLSLIAPNLL